MEFSFQIMAVVIMEIRIEGREFIFVIQEVGIIIIIS